MFDSVYSVFWFLGAYYFWKILWGHCGFSFASLPLLGGLGWGLREPPLLLHL